MKLFKKSMVMLAALLAAGMSHASAEENYGLLFSFKTTLYENAGAANAFHFRIGATEDTFIDVDYGSGPVEVEVGQAIFDSATGGVKGTAVAGSVGKEGIVKVYGDASLIDYLDLEGVYITQLDISPLTSLEILNVNNNYIEELDLSDMTKLQSVEVRANPFDKKPFLLGPNKPNLAIIDISVIDNLDQSFNPSDYPSLLSLEATSCYDLRNCDISGCPELLRLSIDATNVSEVDLSHSPNLLIVNISETRVTEVDLSKCPYLTEFYATHSGSINTEYRLKSVDVTKNPELQRLFITYNFMNSIDLTQNPKLTDLFAAYNDFTELDLDNNPALINLNLSKNAMSFATLPLPRFNFHEYYYDQRGIDVARSYKVGTEIDFSNKVLREGSTTFAGMFIGSIDEDGYPVSIEVDETYYSFADGKVTLLKELPDSVYLAFHNTLFPDYDMMTGNFMIKSEADFGKDNNVLNFRVNAAVSQLSMSIGMGGATTDSPKTFKVDFGDGNLVECTATTSQIPDEPNVVGAVKKTGNIVVYVPEGEDLTAVSLKGIRLTSINLDNAPSLQFVNLDGCNLTKVSVACNRYLSSINVDNNHLSVLDLSCANNISKYKVSLRNVSAANNQIAEFTMPDEPHSLRTVNLANNKITEINLYNTDNITWMDLSGNLLTEIDLDHNMGLKTLNVSDNLLTEIILPPYLVIEELDISKNCFAIPMLPLPDRFTSYSYAPQGTWQLPQIGPTANINSQWLDIDGQTTQYKWYMAENGDAVPEGKITGEEGRFKFVDGNIGLVYCEITHPVFPDFEGENIYRTSAIQTAPIPDNMVFSLTTLADGIGEITMASSAPNTLLYIDWYGTGDYLEEYTLQTTYQRFNMTVHANADVKAYSYNEAAGLTVLSIAAGPLSSLDVSGLNGLIHFTSIGSKLTSDKMKLPAAPDLYELRIDGAAIETIDLSAYPELKYLALNNNQIKSFDAGKYPKLTNLYLRNNVLEELKLDNPLIWELGVDYNNLTTVDLSKLPAIQQLWLSHNKMDKLSFSGLSDLRFIDVSYNNFVFTTLPARPTTAFSYLYNNQAPIEIEVVDGAVDLSSQYMVNDTPTNYMWYLGTPYFDEEGNLYGEELIADDEYVIEDGVTHFQDSFRNVMCVMTNEEFPGLYLYTTFVDVEVSSIEEIEADEAAGAEYYNLQGIRVDNPGHGIYIRRQGDKTSKVYIR